MKALATTVRIDPQLKNAANAVFEELGISLSAGVSAFLKAVVREKGMPFEMKLDADIMPNLKSPKTIEMVVSNKISGNIDLNRAGIAKRDEFYTQLCDIEAELQYYKSSFKNKVVLCNCDDPFESNFFKYFILHFNELKIKKLIATSYQYSSYSGHEYPVEKLLAPYPVGQEKAYKAVVTFVDDSLIQNKKNTSIPKGLFSLPGNSIELLNDDGDFRSNECIALLDSSDIVVTNPPFSLFRDFIGTLISKEKKFLIIGNINAATYKEVFPLIRDNKIWLGASIHSGDRKFYVPDTYPLNAAGCGYDDDGKRYIRVKGIRWYTNLDMTQRHQELNLSETYDPEEYPMFDNYNAINVSRTVKIPYDYSGIMGVPITFLDKYNPDQFDILMLANGNVRANSNPETLRLVGYKRHENDKGGVGVIKGKRSYARILIRNKYPKVDQ
jgi:addiction module antitoxin, relB/dinJ family